jgi:putative tricarboxylic transport membrane protein
MLIRDLACAVLGWALAGAAWIGASQLQRSMLSDDFGADGLPRGLAVLLAVVSTVIAVRAVVAWRRAAPVAASADDETLLQHAKALGIIALGIGYVLLAPFGGYLVTAFALIAATSLHYGARPSATLFGVAAGGAFVLWLTFAKLLGLAMPVGLWARMLG